MNNLRWYSLLMMAAIYLAIFICKEKTNKQKTSNQTEVSSLEHLGFKATQDNFNQLYYSSSKSTELNQRCSVASMEILLMAEQNKWKTILGIPKPENASAIDIAIWHYAQGLAFLSERDNIGANHAIKELNDLYVKLSIDQLKQKQVDTNSIQQILLNLQGEITSTITTDNLLAVNM